MQQGPRVAVIGLDRATPQLLFRDLHAEVPNIAKLMGEGAYGNLASITPPITVPAWACAMTGKVPGQLGIYGFRNRKDTTYEGLAIAHSGSVKEPAVWDALGAHGKRSVLIGVPPSFPPPKEFPGWRVGCFLTPPSAERYAYPQELEVEIEEELEGKGNYIFDIPNFRQAGMEVTLDQVFKMTERRFQVGRRLIQNKPWDFFMLCDIALDRLHHVFWQYVDPTHPLYQPGNQYEATFRDYYRFLDQQVGTLLELIPDDAITMVMSDHGARPMMGGLCFNDWLVQEQYLTLNDPVSKPTPIKEASIDWSRTVAWGDGGYYGRLFLNVKGREPQGIVEPANYEATRDELVAKLEAAPAPMAPRWVPRCSSRRRLPRGAGCRARPDRLLRRPGVALGRRRGQPQHLHLRERHRPRWGQSRPGRHLHREGRTRATHRRGPGLEPGRRRSHHRVPVRRRRAWKAPSEGVSCR